MGYCLFMLWYTFHMIHFDDDQTTKDLTHLKEKEEESLLKSSANKKGILYIDLSGASIQTDALSLIPEQVSRDAQIVAFRAIGTELHVGVRNTEAPAALEEIERLKKKHRVILYLISLRSLQKSWDRYDDLKLTKKASTSLVDISTESVAEIVEKVTKNEDIRTLLIEAQRLTRSKISRIIEIILGSAIATGSSDIHIEPQNERVRLRLRQDGVLQDIAFFDQELFAMLDSRIKVLSGMKITNVHNAQDGRFTIDYNDLQVEVRVSTVPSAYGESIVMRILNPEGLTVGFDQLGFEPRLLEVLKREIIKPNGMMLTTGPTGSGKTTTLYSFLKFIYSDEIKIITIEDPIEYHLQGVSQTQVDHKKGYDFLSGLRAALRQDPDVIMVGEIRDNETATIAVNASLTGHMVLSTLHTNNAAGTIPRLLDLGVLPDILASALSVSLAQRLVRKLCVHCKTTKSANAVDAELIERVINNARNHNKDLTGYGVLDFENPQLSTSPGCEKCAGTGYKGRIGIYEAILMDEAIENILETQPGERDIWQASSKQGLLNMSEDGILKVLSGTTSMEEVRKVVDIEGYLDMTKVSSPQDPEVSQSEINGTTIQDIEKTNDPSLRNLQQKEMGILLDYLKTLEEHQYKYPEVGIAEKIYLVRQALVDLLKTTTPGELFLQAHNEESLHTTLEEIKNKLTHLETNQTKNPYQGIGNEIGVIRNSLEKMEQPLER
ncbi:MAG: type IV pilus assembly protein PilB [Planctomycetota bacterium]|jgi:type IV pilus assembly protein PilB